MRKFERKSFNFGTKTFGSDTDTEIGPWFRFPIPKPDFDRTLLATPCPIFSRDFHFHSDFDSGICRLRR